MGEKWYKDTRKEKSFEEISKEAYDVSKVWKIVGG